MNKPVDTATAREAAAHLAEGLGGTIEGWITWLANDRRRSKLMPALLGKGHPRYSLLTLDSFIQINRATGLSFVGPAGKISGALKSSGIAETKPEKSRQLAYRVAAFRDEKTGEGMLQLFIAHPICAFHLSIEQGRRLSAKLLSEAEAAEELQNNPGINHE